MVNILIVTFVVILSLGDCSQVFAGKQFFAQVVKIIDGDSMIVSTGSKRIELRLYGIDCPEYGQPFSLEAKKYARKNFLSKKVSIKPQYYDTYGRMVAIVIPKAVSNTDLSFNGTLVEAGMAWVYPRYCKKDICVFWKKMEAEAKKERLGLWSSRAPYPPWKWKRAKARK